MKKFSIIFAICFTFVLGEQPPDSKKYDIFGYVVNETCATKYPIIKENIPGSDFKRSGEQRGCAVACILEEKNELFDNGTIVHGWNSWDEEDYEQCEREEGNCKKGACIEMQLLYYELEREDDMVGICVLVLHPKQDNIAEFEACTTACYWKSYGFFNNDGEIPKNYTLPLNTYNYLTSKKVLEDSYETCKTVNGICARAYCMEQEMIRVRDLSKQLQSDHLKN